jgi:hypothetical protein
LEKNQLTGSSPFARIAINPNILSINRPKGHKNKITMKKIATILSVLLIAGSCGGQTTNKQEIGKTENVTLSENIQINADSSPHLSFKGVPIDGTLSEYIAKMKQNGFTLVGIEDETAMLSGDFAGYKNCIVGVATLKQKDLVSRITVIFPECNTWSSLSSNYFSLKKMLSEKYGNPSESVEKFQSSSQPKDDNSKMYEVKFDRCNYYTDFETEKGSIELSIEHESVSSCFVMLSYFDKINSNIIKAKAIDDL